MKRNVTETVDAAADAVARRSYGKLVAFLASRLRGVDAWTIAPSFLVAPSTMGQRLVRAKSKIRDSGIPFRVPGRDELDERLAAVLDSIYAAFAEGWSDPAGTETRRRNLAAEGI